MPLRGLYLMALMLKTQINEFELSKSEIDFAHCANGMLKKYTAHLRKLPYDNGLISRAWK